MYNKNLYIRQHHLLNSNIWHSTALNCLTRQCQEFTIILTMTYLDTHGLSKPLDDGKERESCKHGSLISLSVDDLAEGVGAGGEPPAHSDTLQPNLGQGASTEETQHLRTTERIVDYVYFIDVDSWIVLHSKL